MAMVEVFVVWYVIGPSEMRIAWWYLLSVIQECTTLPPCIWVRLEVATWYADRAFHYRRLVPRISTGANSLNLLSHSRLLFIPFPLTLSLFVSPAITIQSSLLALSFLLFPISSSYTPPVAPGQHQPLDYTIFDIILHFRTPTNFITWSNQQLFVYSSTLSSEITHSRGNPRFAKGTPTWRSNLIFKVLNLKLKSSCLTGLKK